jgi:amino acid transporter
VSVIGASHLRRDTISARGAAVLSLAAISPITAIALFPQVMAALVGPDVPFLILLGAVGVFCVAYTIAQFARWVPHAGSFYAFNSQGLGAVAGFTSGWVLLVTYALALPANMLAFGPIASDTIARHVGWNVPWWVLALAAIVLVTGLVIAGIGISVRVDVALLAAEVVVVLVLAAVIIVRGGDTGNAPDVFTPARTDANSGALVALGFAFLMFVGFEIAYTAAEEIVDARHNLARAMCTAVVLAAGFFVVVSYALVIGFGKGNLDALTSDPLPLGTLATRYLDSQYSVLIEAAVVLALLSATIGLMNGLVRVMYALARDGILPRKLAAVHPRRGTPYVAALLAGSVGAAAALGLGLAVGPFPQAFTYFAAVGALPVLLMYGSASLSLVIYVRRHRPQEFHVVKHVVVPGLGLIIAAAGLYGAYHPFPSGTPLAINLIFLGYLLFGVVLGVRWKRSRPDLMARIGSVAGS